MKITDEMVSAALAAWYPGEWPDDPLFERPADITSETNLETFGERVRREMRATLEAALSLVPELVYRERFAAMAPTAPLPWSIAESFGEPVLIDANCDVLCRVLGGKDEARRIARMIQVAINTCGGYRAAVGAE